MFQPDLFPSQERSEPIRPEGDRALDLPGILERLTIVCERPRYSFMVLNLILRASGQNGSAGPFVIEGGRRVPVREWLCDALVPIAQRDPRRQAITSKVRQELRSKGALPIDGEEAERLVEAQAQERIRQSGLTNVSRAVSELVRAGLVQRHYAGYRVDHRNRGAQRQAVYTVTDEARRALRA